MELRYEKNTETLRGFLKRHNISHVELAKRLDWGVSNTNMKLRGAAPIRMNEAWDIINAVKRILDERFRIMDGLRIEYETLFPNPNEVQNDKETT